MASATHPGLVRSHNEDALIADALSGFAAIADGMGGYNAGEVASRIAVERVSASLQAALGQVHRDRIDDTNAERLLERHIAEANAAVYNAAQSDASYSGMGTTLVVACWCGDRMSVGHVGDSRLYRLREGSLTQLTRDHSLTQDQIDDGVLSPAQARYSAQRSVVTRAVGVEPQVKADIRSFAVAAGDLYILCSDGLTEMLTNVQIQEALESAGPQMQRAADVLVELANARGGRDNISVIVARVAHANQEVPQ